MLSRILFRLFTSKQLKLIEEESYYIYKNHKASGAIPTKGSTYEIPGLIGCLAHALSNHYDDREEFINLYNKVLQRFNVMGINTNRPLNTILVIKRQRWYGIVHIFASPMAHRVHQRAIDRRQYFIKGN